MPVNEKENKSLQLPRKYQMKPGVKDYVGQYVRAVYDFDTTHPREIPLRKGDIIKVTSAVDSNWLCGSQNGKDGNFPASFVEVLSLPAIHEEQKLFGAIENFPAQEKGDLEFRKGALVVGTRQIDENWWDGQIGSHSGIFPLTHVMELELPSVLRERAKSVHSSEPMFAQALCDSTAQLDEELGFKVGDLITVLEVIDNDWYYGELGNKQGIFLASCVELIQDTSATSSSNDNTNSNKNRQSSLKSPDNKRNMLQKSFSFDQSYYGSLNENQSNSSNVNKHLDSSQSNSYSESQSNSSNASAHAVQATEDEAGSSLPIINETTTLSSSAENAAYTSENTRSLDSSVNPYAMTLYQFIGQSDDELSFNENEIVYLIQHVDSQWTEGELDGKIGLFPTSFVSIIVDCPYAFTENNKDLDDNKNNIKVNGCDVSLDSQMKTDETISSHDMHTNLANDQNAHSPGEITPVSDRYALVLHTFDGETEGDLTVKEGDTVVIIKDIDENWIQAQDDQGNIGMCPRHFVEVITESPEILPNKSRTSHVAANNSVIVKPTDSKSKEIEIQSTQNFESDKNKQELESSKTSIKEVIVPAQKKQLIEKDKILALKQNKTHPKTVKPPLGPKPILKPKPSVLPKPSFVKPPEVRKPNVVAFQKDSTLQKSSSTHSLNIDQSDRLHTMHKSHSSTELSENTDIDSKCSNNVQEKPTFENIDLSKSLSALVSEELSKAKEDAEVRSRSSSDKSSSSVELPNSSTQSEQQSEEKKVAFNSDSSVSFRNKDYKKSPNTNRHSVNFPLSVNSRTNTNQTKQSTSSHGRFLSSRSSSVASQYSTGHSTFFVDPVESVAVKPPVRKPPPIPQRSFEQDQSQFDRKPSLRKAPPPRPTGPRLASAPSKEPLVPEKVIPQRTPPNRPAPTRPQRKVPSRPAPTAPTRPHEILPQPRRPPPRAPPQSDLMSFASPTRETFVEANEEIITDLRKKIKDTEMDLENFKKELEELQQKHENCDESESEEIKENIEFYNANIKGLTEERNKLKEDLLAVSPEECDLAAKQMEEEARKAEEEKRKEEERQKAEEMKVKRMEKRGKVIEEIVQTEKDFLKSLRLCLETFCSPESDKHIEVDIDIIFGNMEDIADMSQSLLTLLEGAIQGKDFQEQTIGTCFVVLAEDMKNAFAPYCRNHDEAIALMERYNSNPSVSQYFENMLNKLRDKCVVFDLEALLIKPVQRILKYPLLLNELSKSTEDDHPDHAEILNAINEMTDVATAINEYKRRKDLVYKYKKETDESFGDKLAKLNLHSLKKKGSRFKGRLSTNLGLTPQTKDETFDREEIRFHQLEKIVKVFGRNVQSYMDQVQDSVSCHESLVVNMVDFYDEKQVCLEITKFQQAQSVTEQKFLPLFLSNVRDMVIIPLSKLSVMFEAPNKVIQKRFDKLLDYDSMLRKSKDEKASEKALQTSKNDYEALNAQLLDELPKLYNLSFQLLQDCIWAFVAAQRDYTNNILIHMTDMLDKLTEHEMNLPNQSPHLRSLPSLLSTNDNVVEVFNIRHVSVVDKLSGLSFIPKGFNPKMDAVKQVDKKSKRQSVESTKLSTENTSAQIDSQKVYLRQQYQQDKLFDVTQTYQSTDLMDISLFEGDVVGVVMEKDPMGNKDRWFVDNGVAKGFVPSSILKSCQKTSVPLPNENLYPTVTPVPVSPITPAAPLSPISLYASTRQGHSPSVSSLPPDNQIPEEFDEFLDEDMTPDISDEIDQSISQGQEEFYYAEFEFRGRTGNEVSLFEGQVVTVLAKHDEKYNTEWWFVDADGVKGYAPSSYLQPMK